MGMPVTTSQKHTLAEIIDFGEQLLKTGDLDPVYIALWEAKLPKKQLKRLLLAYFFFYQLGVAARLSEMEGAAFWGLAWAAAENQHIPPSMDDLPGDRWPRGTERRHFRGPKCIAAIDVLRRKHEDHPEYHIDDLFFDDADSWQLETIMDRVKLWPMCGDWIAFKVPDIIERVVGNKIVFPENLTLLYKEPRAALDMLTIPAEEASKQLLKHFGQHLAPPRRERSCGVAETETMLCKWKSFVHDKYYVGKDIHEIRSGLKGWGSTADKLLKHMPKEVGEGLFR